MQQRNPRTRIDRKLFLKIGHEIKVQLAAGTYHALDVAQKYGVSIETVRVIYRAGTWPQFERDKQARRKRVEQPAEHASPTSPADEGEVTVGVIVDEDMVRLVDRLNAMERRIEEVESRIAKLLNTATELRIWVTKLDTLVTVKKRPVVNLRWGRR